MDFTRYAHQEWGNSNESLLPTLSTEQVFEGLFGAKGTPGEVLHQARIDAVHQYMAETATTVVLAEPAAREIIPEPITSTVAEQARIAALLANLNPNDEYAVLAA